MFVPLHYQPSEYDCVPTAFINAIAALFERHEVPPMVIRHIYTYSLDTVGRGARLGRAGTSKPAVRLLGHWLASYRSSHFSLDAEYLGGDEVDVSTGGPVLACLRDGGVVLLNVRLTKGEEHFVTALDIEDEWVRCWDPYYRRMLRGLKGRVRVLESDGRTPNLAIQLDWLDGTVAGQRFSLGPRPDREALLVWRR